MCLHPNTPNPNSANTATKICTIADEFCIKSAIPRKLFETAVAIIPDVEYDELSHEVTATPINDALGWTYTRFTRMAKPNYYAAEFRQEDGSPWMLKIYDGTREYKVPKGNGDVPYLPMIPLELGERIAEHYGVEPPNEGESLWDWLKRNRNVPLVITEGGKKALSVIGIGVPATALYGCRCGAKNKDEDGKYQPVQLTKELKPLVKGRVVYIAFDQDTKPTARKAVGKGIRQLGKAIKNAGGKPFVTTWNPKDGKGVDDLIANCGAPAFFEALARSVAYDIYELEQRVKLTYKPSLVISTPDISNTKLPRDKKLIGIRSAKGTGKTELLAKQVQKYINAGKRVLVITHRVKLGEEIAERLGINYVSEIWKDDLGKTLGFCLCVDSLHAKSQAVFNAENWADAAVIIDEAEQVIEHMLCANTSVKQYRREILENFHRLMEIAGTIILSEADLSDKSINYIRSLAGKIEPWLLLNKWKPERGYHITHYDWANPDFWTYSLIEYIEKGGRPLICTDTQKTKSKWSTKNLERLVRILFPDLKVLRIDSETLKDPDHIAFGCMSNLNEVLPKFELVIASPCIETGVSINFEHHFTSVWAKSEGVQTSNAFRQTLMRLRAMVPRHLYIAPQGKTKGETSPNRVIRLAKKGFRALVNQLGDLDESNIGYQEDGNQTKHLWTWALTCANNHAQSYHYRQYTLYKLLEEGHSLEHLKLSKEELKEIKPEIEKLGKMLDEIKNGHYQEECKAHAEERNPSDKELEQLQAKNVKTQEEQRVERKGVLSRRYGEKNVTPELVAQDDEGMFLQLQLHFWLTVGRVFVKQRDIDRITMQSKNNNGKLYIPDAVRDAYTTKVLILEILRIPELLALPEDSQFRNDDPLLAHIGETARKYADDIQATFNHKVPVGGSNTEIAQMFLGKLGLKMPSLGRKGPRDNRKYVYGYPVSKYDPDNRKIFFEYWKQQQFEKQQSASSGHQSERSSHPIDIQSAPLNVPGEFLLSRRLLLSPCLPLRL